jgi:hypothetical protein
LTYWLDSNVFIQCANRIYKFGRYPEFWNFLAVKFEQQTIRSSEFVYRELVKGNDHLAAWCKSRKETGLNTAALHDVQESYKLILDLVEHEPKYQRAHRSEFYRVADCWLIAHAHADNGTVVTHETERETGKIKVSSVCGKMNVRWIDVYGLQDELDFKPSDYRGEE